MRQFEYKFVEISSDGNLKNGTGETFERCKRVISDEAAEGWRLVQIVNQAERKNLCGSYQFEIVLERET